MSPLAVAFFALLLLLLVVELAVYFVVRRRTSRLPYQPLARIATSDDPMGNEAGQLPSDRS